MPAMRLQDWWATKCLRAVLSLLLWKHQAGGQIQASFSDGELAGTWQRPVGQRGPGAVLARSAHLSHANVWGGALEEVCQE